MVLNVDNVTDLSLSLSLQRLLAVSTVQSNPTRFFSISILFCRSLSSSVRLITYIFFLRSRSPDFSFSFYSYNGYMLILITFFSFLFLLYSFTVCFISDYKIKYSIIAVYEFDALCYLNHA